MRATTWASFLLTAAAAAETSNTSVKISQGVLAGGMLTETAGGSDCQLPPASPPPSTGPFSRQACLDAINKYRSMKGLSSIALCNAERQTLVDRQVQYDGDRHAAHEYWKKCGSPKGSRGQCEAGRFGSAARAVEAYWNEGPPKKGGFNHYSIMMSTKNTCVACGFSQKNYNLGQTWTYAHNFYTDGNPPSPPSPSPTPSPPTPPSPPSPPSPPPTPPSPGPSDCGTCKVCFNPANHKCQTGGPHRPKTEADCKAKGHIWCNPAMDVLV